MSGRRSSRSGRGLTRGGRGRSGRGSSRSSRTTSSSSSSSTKTEIKFYPHGSGGYRQVVTYDTVKDAICEHVQRNYKYGQDIAKSLRDLQLIDLTADKPTRKRTTVVIPAADIDPTTGLVRNQADIDAAKEDKEFKQQSLDVDYEKSVEIYMDRVTTLANNIPKAYALIMSSYCGKTMKSRVEEHPSFASTVQDDPIELLKLIQTLMHDPQRAKYPYATLTDSFTRLLNILQAENEELLDYVKRFKQERDIVISYIGSDILDEFTENTEEYRKIEDADPDVDAKREYLKKGAFTKWMAFLMLRNADKARYGTLYNDLVSHYS